MKGHYRDLIVWQRSIDLAPEIYQLTKSFPKEETYALGDQMRRAVVSIAANISEGQARQHPKEFLQHLSIAKGSLAELHTLLILTQRFNYVDQKVFDEFEMKLSLIGKPLSGLIAHLKFSPTTKNQ